VALLGEVAIPFEYAGVHAGRISRGSRPEGSPEFQVGRADAYLGLLAEHSIVADPEVRRALIVEQANQLAQGVGGHIPNDPALLGEVTNLVEQPTSIIGHFDKAYLRLPTDVLTAVMKKHQRYFPVADGDGNLLPYFIAVRNGGDEHLETVRHGNEEVIRARFSDASFFYQEDTKKPLDGFLPRLATLTWQERLGSMLDKTRRLEALVPRLAEMIGLSVEEAEIARRAALLCKADLATQMVVELTSLQGVMGQEYALKGGEAPDVARAIYEHYLPRFAGDHVPQTRSGLVVGLADRLDSLVGLFAVGLAPTGSSDPYQLRRQALGLVQGLISRQVAFSVREGLAAAADLQPVEVSESAIAAALDFVTERLRGYLRDRGFGFDVVDAVLAARGDDPYRATKAVEELAAWVARDDWSVILDNYARCVRITRELEKRFRLDATRFVRPAERELYSAYQEADSRITPASTVKEFLTAFLPLVDIIDRYFARESGVLVMAEDQALRENRLAQLQHIAALADGIIDLSRLEGF
jgi:glycyl-tRNA synthetase